MWITDRQPSKEGLYMVTEQIPSGKVIGISRWNGEEWEVLPFSEVIAWAELPEAYGVEHDKAD